MTKSNTLTALLNILLTASDSFTSYQVGSTNRDSAGQGELVRVPLFLKSHCAIRVPAYACDLYHMIVQRAYKLY